MTSPSCRHFLFPKCIVFVLLLHPSHTSPPAFLLPAAQVQVHTSAVGLCARALLPPAQHGPGAAYAIRRVAVVPPLKLCLQLALGEVRDEGGERGLGESGSPGIEERKGRLQPGHFLPSRLPLGEPGLRSCLPPSPLNVGLSYGATPFPPSRWAWVTELPPEAAQRQFLQELLGRLVRLSYWRRIYDVLPEQYRPLLGPEPQVLLEGGGTGRPAAATAAAAAAPAAVVAPALAAPPAPAAASGEAAGGTDADGSAKMDEGACVSFGRWWWVPPPPDAAGSTKMDEGACVPFFGEDEGT